MAEDKLDEFLPDDQQEDIDDIEIEENWFSGPTLWSTDWTTETLVSQLRRGNINLDPRYQRRNAWDTKRKSLFIESLVLGLPIPQIILAEEKGKKGNFVVIDGKQRLLALRQFAVNQDERTGFKPLKLTGLKEREDLNGLSYDDIRNRLDLADDVNNFDNQTVRTVVIRGWSSEKYLYSVFLRINTGSVQLSTQELRQALHPGPFSDYIDDFSVESEPLKSALKLKQPDFRMRDTELVLRYFAYRNFLGHYKGNLKLFLDNATKDLNARWKNDSAQIQDQAKDLEKANQAKTEFMANMSHDLRTPLNAIIGFSEIMTKEMFGKLGSEKYLEYSKDINQSSAYLLSLISDILDMSAIDADQRVLDLEDFDLKMLIDECARSLNPLIDEKEQVLSIKFEDDFPIVRADKRSVQQILINLISNAIKFAANAGKIDVDSHFSSSSIFITVRDNGQGIDDLDALFEPFYTTKGKGLGLGLTISQRIMASFGGTIAVGNHPQGGAVFTLTLPIKQEPEV